MSKRVPLSEVAKHTIVRTQDGRYGVAMGHVSGYHTNRRIIDFWEGGREYVPATEKVEVLERPSRQSHSAK